MGNGMRSNEVLCAAMGCLLVLSAIPGLAAAQSDSKVDWSLDVSAGVEYDGRITVNEIDADTGQGDTVALFRAALKMEADVTPETEFSLGYSFSQKKLFDLTAYDLQLHGLSADVNHDLGAVKVGVAGNYYFTRLGGNDFLTMARVSPYVSYFKDGIFIKLAYLYTDRDLESGTARDTKVHAVDGDFFYFFDSNKSYFSASYRFEKQDAVDDPYDFDSHNLSAKLKKRVVFMDLDSAVSFGWRYEKRSYDHITPSIAAIRDDERNLFDLEWEIPFKERYFVAFHANRNLLKSNLASVDYNETIYGVRVGASF